MSMRPGMRRAVRVLGLSAVLTPTAVHAASVSRAGRSTDRYRPVQTPPHWRPVGIFYKRPTSETRPKYGTPVTLHGLRRAELTELLA